MQKLGPSFVSKQCVSNFKLTQMYLLQWHCMIVVGFIELHFLEPCLLELQFDNRLGNNVTKRKLHVAFIFTA